MLPKMSGVTKAYWPNFHKLINIAFKLTNTLPMHNKKPIKLHLFKT